MTSVQLHLALNHVPVILSIVGLMMLIVSFFIKNNTVTKIAYVFLLVAAVAAIPVYLTGEGTEEAVEHLPGVSESIIEEHEEVAKLGLIAIIGAGILALGSLAAQKWQAGVRVLRVVVLLAALISGGLMAQTAHLGGQIRHSEIRNGNVVQTDNQEGDTKKDDD